jgi:four helix bundle protein
MARERPPVPYDIRARVFRFLRLLLDDCPPKQRLDPPTLHMWTQLLDAAGSSGAHLEEAEAGATRRHFVTLMRGALREMREADYWLRAIVVAKLDGYQKVEDLTTESPQLVAILTTICKNADRGFHGD